ncbi:uncharacterized protein BX663DRAFT_559194 [Cokeromyces recurvatus]|uniref:uncharacterized protein n=1 Tax=Cokeromyces recurvatus TaxID=90255 RepID=UPI002220AF98|nr:uncharacterized protein BX663DRAFT_559194 [Cokeromyces recurvatus]KAI7904937.1 hypothetical protein BX663DRAFT_559194 [Cokeromyces recurvatus]
MKDGFKLLEIEPTEGYLDFVGPAKISENKLNEPLRVLKGEVRITLTKPVKIRNMFIKFKGFSSITLSKPYNIEANCPFLPKLKLSLFGKTTLPAGDHIIPWELDIPNIYPRSLLIKRASIHYKVIVSISTGITSKSITAEYPIIIRRHLLPYKELAPLIETRIFQRTVPGKFHYEIDIPQIICIEQEYIPMAIKYVSIANQKPVQSIRTRLIQIELYRFQPLSKSDYNLTTMDRDSFIFNLDKKIINSNYYKDNHVKYIKRSVPALIHLTGTSTSIWKRPCLVRHGLYPYLSYTLVSPLISIYHQVEVTFQFGQKYEEIKSKIPIIIASVPQQGVSNNENSPSPELKYAFEEAARSDYLKYVTESSTKNNDMIDNNRNEEDSYGSPLLRDISTNIDVSLDSSLNDRLKTMNPISTTTTATTTTTTTTTNINTLFPVYNNNSKSLFSLSPHSDYHLAYNHNHQKKFASAVDLSTDSIKSINDVDDFEGLPTERPRTTTPTMRRNRKILKPIDVDLANGKKQYPTPAQLLSNECVDPEDISKADIFSIAHYQYKQLASASIKNQNLYHCDITAFDSINHDDLLSVCSETSILSANMPISAVRSHPSSLHSRPPSPGFTPAPGIPATIALQPQYQNKQAIEELFPAAPDSATISLSSFAMNTIASSTLLSHRTSDTTQKRIALSSISSLTNDSLIVGPPSSNSSHRRVRSSSAVDPDIQSLIIQHNALYSSSLQYIYEKLPPLPSDLKSTKRLTKVYLDDSDEEEHHKYELPPIPSQLPSLNENNNNNNIEFTQVDIEPPKLPRLSFGKDFSISLGIQ